MKKQKVFREGFQETGTSCLGIALRQLGCQVCGDDSFRDFASEWEIDEALFKNRLYDLAVTHDVFKDTPWQIIENA